MKTVISDRSHIILMDEFEVS